MFYNFQILALSIWELWSGMFGFIPYGDPYLAAVVLFVVAGASAKLIAGGESI